MVTQLRITLLETFTWILLSPDFASSNLFSDTIRGQFFITFIMSALKFIATDSQNKDSNPGTLSHEPPPPLGCLELSKSHDSGI